MATGKKYVWGQHGSLQPALDESLHGKIEAAKNLTQQINAAQGGPQYESPIPYPGERRIAYTPPPQTTTPAGKAPKKTNPKSPGLTPFGKAFAEARARGESIFSWNGKEYTTQVAGEAPALANATKPVAWTVNLPEFEVIGKRPPAYTVNLPETEIVAQRGPHATPMASIPATTAPQGLAMGDLYVSTPSKKYERRRERYLKRNPGGHVIREVPTTNYAWRNQ